MQVHTLPTTQTITVTLTLGGTVQLLDPELWQFADGDDAKLPDPSQDDSQATWSGIPAPAAGVLDLIVFWNAIEPQHDQWDYSAFVEVSDQSGARLPGLDGENPHEIPSKIGEGQPSFGRGSHSIFVRA